MIIDNGPIAVPWAVYQAAYSVRLQNNKVNTPKNFQRQLLHDLRAAEVVQQIADIAGVPSHKIDYVYFGCCLGAEPHTDALDPAKYTNRTFMVPICMPADGLKTLTVGGQTIELQLNHVYEFDHTIEHSLFVGDKAAGCTVIMASVLK
jgi:hypothetical protein